MNAPTAGDSAAFRSTIGGRRVNISGNRCCGPPRARMPLWQMDPRLEGNLGSQAAMTVALAPPAAPAAAAAPSAVPTAADVAVAPHKIDSRHESLNWANGGY